MFYSQNGCTVMQLSHSTMDWTQDKLQASYSGIVLPGSGSNVRWGVWGRRLNINVLIGIKYIPALYVYVMYMYINNSD